MAEKVLGEDKKYLTRYVKKMTQDTYNEVLQVILSYYASTGSLNTRNVKMPYSPKL
jgi:hypothetical protein